MIFHLQILLNSLYVFSFYTVNYFFDDKCFQIYFGCINMLTSNYLWSKNGKTNQTVETYLTPYTTKVTDLN